MATAKKNAKPAAPEVEAEAPPAAERPFTYQATLVYDQIIADPDNPRKAFDADALAELADSIREHGLVQPLEVRPEDADGKYRLIAGERRWRAIGQLIADGGVPAEFEIPVGVAKVDARMAALRALVENLQREDLNPMEEARAFARLRDDHGLSTAQISGQLGKGRSQRHVQDRLQLLKLDEDDQAAVAGGNLSIERARERTNEAERLEKTYSLTAAEQLMLGEIADKLERQPRRKDTYDKQTEVAHDAASPVLNRLKKLDLVRIGIDLSNGRAYVHQSYRWYDARKAGITEPIAPDAAGLYKTAFLNGPFELSPEQATAQADKKKIAAEVLAATKKAKEAAALRAETVTRIEEDPPIFLPALSLDLVREVARDGKAPLPWSLDKYGMLRDANGQRLGNFSAGSWDSVADPHVVRSLFLLLVNAAAPPESAEPTNPDESEPDAPAATGDEFSRHVREAIAEDA